MRTVREERVQEKREGGKWARHKTKYIQLTRKQRKRVREKEKEGEINIDLVNQGELNTFDINWSWI